MLSTQSQRDEERKKARKETTEERRQAREATMILEKQDEKMTLTDLRKNTKEITDVVQDGNLKEVIEKSKKPVTKEEKRGKGEATLRLIEQIQKDEVDEAKLQAEVKQKPITRDEVVTTSCGVHGFNLEINKVIDIKAIGGTKRLPERLSFEMQDGRRHVWPVQLILTQDYKTFVSVYNMITKDNVHGRQVTADVQQKICSIRKEKGSAEDLRTKMIVPNPTNKKIHFEPFYMMEFRDPQGQRRFFRMEDNLKTISNEDLRTLQSYLDDRVEYEHRLKLAFQR